MPEPERHKFAWMDFVWLAFLGGLALLHPIVEIHKQLTLLAIGIFQLLEQRFLDWAGPRGPVYSVILKILLASLLIGHTGGINSSYYLIYFLPVVTAAIFFGPWATLAWTAAASAAYLSFLAWIPWSAFELSAEGATELAIRNLFFFLAALLVNRFVVDSRRQAANYRRLAEELAETNRQLQRAEAEARRSERLGALGRMSAGLAHEIRNPLGIIKGSAESLSKRLASGDAIAVELAGYISSEVNRLNSIVTRFLDFARPHELEKHPEEIIPLIERALTAARERWPEAKVEVERQYAGDLAPVPVDAALCEQVFLNLVMNAYEAMSEQGGKLRVSIRAATPGGGVGVEVEIEDSGPGIPENLREQIFNPFFTTKQSGVGLGLSIVSKIVDVHRGWIRVQSAPGKGACFRVFLPAEEGQPGAGG
jgi:two-component system, NtrC family, sensor histidine kinase HydH